MAKEWVDVYGYEDTYEVNIEGKVRNKKTGNIMAEYSSGHMYNYVQLNKYGKTIKHYVHRLIAMHFIPNPGGYKQVNHIDLNKRNNHIDNLEWVTPGQNLQHAIDNGAFEESQDRQLEALARGRAKKKKPIRKLTKEEVQRIRLLYEEGVSKKYISHLLKVGTKVIRNVLEGRTYANY